MLNGAKSPSACPQAASPTALPPYSRRLFASVPGSTRAGSTASTACRNSRAGEAFARCPLTASVVLDKDCQFLSLQSRGG